jgi:hypothetical protein
VRIQKIYPARFEDQTAIAILEAIDKRPEDFPEALRAAGQKCLLSSGRGTGHLWAPYKEFKKILAMGNLEMVKFNRESAIQESKNTGF